MMNERKRARIERREKVILEALVEDYPTLYNENAAFHDQMKTLAGLIHVWIDGIAARAIEEEEARRQLLEFMEKEKDKEWVLSPEDYDWLVRRLEEPAQVNPGLEELFRRPSPFAEESDS